jgi:hypothetical protein
MPDRLRHVNNNIQQGEIMAYHLSIFVENKPGKLEKITKVLSDNQINLRAISVASSGDFGVVKVLVNDPDKAYAALKAERITVSKRKIIIAVIDDRPGGLHNLLVTLSSNHINIEDCYGFVLEDKKTAAIVLEVEKYPEAEKILSKVNIKVLGDEQIYSI